MLKRRVVVGAFSAIAVFALCCPSTSEAKPKRKKVAAASAPSSEATPTGGDWSLQEKEYWSKLQEELDGYMARANKQCGTSIKATFDKESFRGHFTEGGSYGISSYARSWCAAGPGALEEICTTVNNDEAHAKAARDAVKAKITTVECKWGGKGKQAIDLSNKTLRTTIDMDSDTDNAASYQTKVVAYAKSKL